MTGISLPECGILVNGLPCKRWPGHTGPCINKDGTEALGPEDLIMNNPPPEISAFPEMPDLERILVIGGRLLLAAAYALAILGIDTGLIIYLLVRLPCHRSK